MNCREYGGTFPEVFIGCSCYYPVRHFFGRVETSSLNGRRICGLGTIGMPDSQCFESPTIGSFLRCLHPILIYLSIDGSRAGCLVC